MSTKSNRRVRVYRWSDDNIEVCFGGGMWTEGETAQKNVSFEKVSKSSIKRFERLVLETHPVVTFISINPAYASMHLDFKCAIQ